MVKIRLVAISSALLVVGCVATATAGESGENVSAKKIFIKDPKPEKRQIQLQSADAAVQFSDAGDPSADGASLHVYSATDDFCVSLPAGAAWKNKKDKKWVYKSGKNAAQIKDGKLLVTLKSGITFTLADDGTQGTVNARVQFGNGTRFCLKCSGNKKDDAKKFLGKDCAAAACDPELSTCNTGTTTTTTTGGTSTTGGSTTTLPSGGGKVLRGALTATPGRFNYNLTVGLPGADAACNTNFPGTHACTYTELQSAETAGDLVGLKDTGGNTVTSFWVIGSPTPSLTQCLDDSGSGLNWEYGTAHTASRGTRVDLDNAAGTLGAVQAPQQCMFSSHWVGCCL